MALTSLFRRNPHRTAAHTAYVSIVEQARAPEFFLQLDVPDTLDGRFEMIAVHMFLVLNRLKVDHEQTSDFAQALFDAMFADLDRALREMGASDMSVGKRVKDMAKGFYGRIKAYEEGLAGDDQVFADALRRNLYGTVKPRPEAVAAMAHYMRSQAAALARQLTDDILANNFKFDPITILL